VKLRPGANDMTVLMTFGAQAQLFCAQAQTGSSETVLTQLDAPRHNCFVPRRKMAATLVFCILIAPKCKMTTLTFLLPNFYSCEMTFMVDFPKLLRHLTTSKT